MKRITYARLFSAEDGFDEELFDRMLAEPIAPLPRPAPVPDAGRDLAAAIAVRIETTVPRTRSVRDEDATIRPGALR